MCFIGFMWYTATRVGVGGNVVDGRAPSYKGLRSPLHLVISRKSCQDNHSPEAQAKVKIKSLEESRRVGLTQQVTPLIMRVFEHCATPVGSTEGTSSFQSSTAVVSVLWFHRWLTGPGMSVPVFFDIYDGSYARV